MNFKFEYNLMFTISLENIKLGYQLVCKNILAIKIAHMQQMKAYERSKKIAINLEANKII